MLSRCLVVFLAMGLTAAKPVPQDRVPTCADVKPLVALNVAQLAGDWIVLTTQIITNGAPLASPTPPPNSPHKHPRDVCLMVHMDVNATAGLVTGYIRTEEDRPHPFHLRVSAEEKGRWFNLDRPGKQLLIVSAVPDKYFIVVGCSSTSPHPHPGIDVLVISRYHPQSGAAAVDGAALENLVTKYDRILGVPYLEPTKFDHTCFESP